MSITNLHGAEEKSHNRQESPDSYSGSLHSLSPLINSDSPQKKSKIVREHNEEEKTALIEKLKSSSKFRTAIANRAEEKRNQAAAGAATADNQETRLRNANLQSQASTERDEKDRSDDTTTEARDTKWYDNLFLEQIKNINPKSSQKELEYLKTIVSQTSMSPHNKAVFINQINTRLLESEVDEKGERVTTIAAAVMEEEAGCNSPTNSGYASESDNESVATNKAVAESSSSTVYLSTPSDLDACAQAIYMSAITDKELDSIIDQKINAIISSHFQNHNPNDLKAGLMQAGKFNLGLLEAEIDGNNDLQAHINAYEMRLETQLINTTKKTCPKKPKAPQLSEDKDFGISDEDDAATTERWNQRMDLLNAWLKIQQENLSRYLSTWISK